MAYAPSAILAMYNRIKAGAPASWNVRNGGIVGDVNHSFGYHLAPNQLPSSDYSRQLSPDRGTGVDPNAASALDVTLSPTGMVAATKNLIKSAQDPNDPRMEGIREFMGTVNLRDTVGRANDGDYEWYTISGWDASHLWHVHISIFRKYANNKAKLLAVADAMLGKPYVPTTGGSYMNANTADLLNTVLPSRIAELRPEGQEGFTVRDVLKAAKLGQVRGDELAKRVDAIEAKVDQILALLKK